MIKSLKLTNFQSWKSLQFDFTSGITLIDGVNQVDGTREGVGKSAIPNSLAWGLYGKLPKDVKIDEVIHFNSKSCKVEVEFDKFKVVRSRKPDDLYIERDGKKLKGKDAKETNKLIETYVGFSFNTFKQAIYFAQKDNSRFINAGEEERIRIFEELLNFNVFTAARKRAHEYIKGLEKELSDADNQRRSAARELDLHKKSINSYTNIIKNQNQKYLAQKQAMEGKLSELIKKYKNSNLNTNLHDTDALLSDIEKLQKGVDLAKEKQQSWKLALHTKESLEKSIQTQTTLLESLNQQIEDSCQNVTCPQCSHNFPAKHTPKALEPSLKRVQSQLKADTELLERLVIPTPPTEDLKALESKLAIQKHNYSTYLQANKKIQAQKSFCDKLMVEIKGLEKSLKELKPENTKDMQAEVKKLEQHVLKLQQKLTQLDQLIVDLNKQKSKYEVLKDAFKEIKSYLFQTTLKTFSYKTNAYAQNLFESPINIDISNISDSGVGKIRIEVTHAGKQMSLGMFSGGQHKRLELAINLALSDILTDRSGKNWGLRIFDEVMESLSLSSKERILDMMSNYKYSTLLIEHDDTLKTLVHNKIMISYDGVESTL